MWKDEAMAAVGYAGAMVGFREPKTVLGKFPTVVENNYLYVCKY